LNFDFRSLHSIYIYIYIYKYIYIYFIITSRCLLLIFTVVFNFYISYVYILDIPLICNLLFYHTGKYINIYVYKIIFLFIFLIYFYYSVIDYYGSLLKFLILLLINRFLLINWYFLYLLRSPLWYLSGWLAGFNHRMMCSEGILRRLCGLFAGVYLVSLLIKSHNIFRMYICTYIYIMFVYVPLLLYKKFYYIYIFFFILLLLFFLLIIACFMLITRVTSLLEFVSRFNSH